MRDLMAGSRIADALGREGWRTEPIEDMPALEEVLRRETPALVVLDLDAARAEDVVGACRPLKVPVLAFGPHVDAARLRSAREAGCTLVVPRSSFFANIAGLAASIGSVDLNETYTPFAPPATDPSP